MPPESQPPQKRRRLPFKAPRRQSPAAAGPSTAVASSSKVKKPAAKPKKTNATASSSKTAKGFTSARDRLHADTESPASRENGSDQDSGSDSSRPSNREHSASQEPDYILAEITHAEPENDIVLGEPAIPAKLLTKLLHHHFQNEKTKIAKDANEVVAKYVDVFVREALARAAFERSEGGGSSSVADGFLEVEDLEKMAPQLVLDF